MIGAQELTLYYFYNFLGVHNYFKIKSCLKEYDRELEHKVLVLVPTMGCAIHYITAM